MNEPKIRNPFLDTIRSPQSYRNIAYLLLSFPTGLFYFIMLILGSSLGMGLIVIGVGVLILWLFFGLSQWAANFERWLANKLLRADIDNYSQEVFSTKAIGKGENWKAIFFLFLKFPLGILSLIITTTVISLVLGMITAPFYYSYDLVQIGGRSIDSLWEALLASVFGIVLLPLGLMMLNKIAWWWRSLNISLLDKPAEEKSKRQSRLDIEVEILQRLVDEGRIDESDSIAYYEEKRKNSSY